MKDPNIINMSDEWLLSLSRIQAGIDYIDDIGRPKKKWVPCRAVGYASFLYRLKAVWLVFTGKADALIWPGGQ